MGSEFDYRPELEQLKEVILAYLIINPINKQSNDNIANESEELLHDDIRYSKDEVLIKNRRIEDIYQSTGFRKETNCTGKDLGLFWKT